MSEEKKDLGQEILKEINQDHPKTEHTKKPFLGKAAIPLLAIVTGLIIGALMIAVTSQTVYAAFGDSIGKGFVTAFTEIGTAYKALFTGAIGDPIRMIDAVKAFDIIFAITQGGPGSASETINVYLYSVAFVYYDIGYGSAIALVFFNPSMRTRTSFEIAAKRLGADAVSITASGSSVSKGESLVDTLNTLAAMRPSRMARLLAVERSTSRTSTAAMACGDTPLSCKRNMPVCWP